MKAATAAEERPEWLPEGWKVVITEGEDGEKVECYTSAASEHTFYSKQEVLRYRGVTKIDGHTFDATPISEHNETNVALQVSNSPEWLPHGWIVEVRARLSGDKAGQKYKSYFDPFSGSRFYSKVEALRFLKSRDPCSPTSGEKSRFKASTTDNVIAQIEYSPDGLPRGWIKETVFRKSKSNTTGIRKDPYYTDPVSGYVFRSLKEAQQYVETGKPSKYAIGPRKSSTKELFSLEKKSPLPVPAKEVQSQIRIGRCLSKEEVSTSNGKITIESNESHGEEKPKQTRSTRKRSKPENKKQNEELLNKPSNENEALEINKSQGEEEPKQSRLTRNRSKPHNGSKSEELFEKLPNESRKSNEKGTIEINKSQEEEKPKQSRPPNKRSRPENENKSEELFEKPINESIEINESQEEKPNQSSPPNKKSKSQKNKEPITTLENLSQLTNETTPVTQERKPRKSKEASISVPRRLSKRLAGLEPTPSAELIILSKGDHKEIKESKESVPSVEPERIDTIEEEASHREQQVFTPSTEPETINTIEEASHGDQEPLTEQTSSFALPFVSTWDDPCIEFAVKTLMGEIPVLDEGLAIEEYFQKQRSTAEASMPSTSNNTLAFNNQGLDTGKLVGPLELPKEPHFSVNNDEGKSCSLKNGMPSNAEASRVRG